MSNVEILKGGNVAETKNFVCSINASLLSEENQGIQVYQIQNKLTNVIEHEAQYLASAILTIMEMQTHLDAVFSKVEAAKDDTLELVDAKPTKLN